MCLNRRNPQDNRIWFQYGGQYSPPGSPRDDCPTQFHGAAVVDGVSHDISALSTCATGLLNERHCDSVHSQLLGGGLVPAREVAGPARYGMGCGGVDEHQTREPWF